jgi:5-methyltetrahydropteroyltriglutamate--homocysteine methyltransferase
LKRSRDRILTTHTGRLPRPDALGQMLFARERRLPFDSDGYDACIDEAVLDAVQKQVRAGIDILSDGEESKPNFSSYVRERFGGVEEWQDPPNRRRGSIMGHDMSEFADYWRTGFRSSLDPGPNARNVVVIAPLSFTGSAAVERDIARFRSALDGQPGEEAFMPSVSPGTIEHWLWNEHYQDDESFLFAVAEAMRSEYLAIVDAGLLVQIDDPDVADGYQMHPEMDYAAYRKHASLRIEALNHGLRGIPEERVRYHVCWGAYRGPHKHDIPLREILDLVLSVRAGAYSIEGSNPRHAHEWRVWQEVKLPEDKLLLPGVVGHCTDWIEHPELVAQRLMNYVYVAGRERVIASTDCGLGNKVEAGVAWAKLEALAEGARIASERLWRQ